MRSSRRAVTRLGAVVAVQLACVSLLPSLVGAARLRSGTALAKAAPAPEKPDTETMESLETFFQLQYIGIQENGIEMPRSPVSPKANLCVTTGDQDDLQGVSLSMTPCESKQIGDPKLNGLDPKEHGGMSEAEAKDRKQRQLFSFLLDGKIRQKTTGLCIRRAKCDDNRFAYDLGDCMDAGAAVFVVDRANANNPTMLKRMGTPVAAVTDDICPVFCGPYRVRQHCKGVQLDAGGGCQQNFHAAPGWTKLPSQYAPPSNDPGAMQGGLTELFNDAQETLGTDGESVKAGLAPLDQAMGGICKSFIGDGPDSDSWFYFLRTSETGKIYKNE